MREIRKLKSSAVQKFREFLDAINSGQPTPFPSQLIRDDAWSEKVADITDNNAPDSNGVDLTNRYSLASDLHQIIQGSTLEKKEWLQPEIWAWFSVLYFRKLCPTKDGAWKPGAEARWIPQMTWRRYYRHLFAGPFRVYLLHERKPDLVRGILDGKPTVPGEAYEQIASRLEVVQSEGVMKGFTRLYWDGTKKTLKRGSRGKVKGGVRRYADLVNQLTLTWDMNRVDSIEFISLLPDEFNKFRETAKTS